MLTRFTARQTARAVTPPQSLMIEQTSSHVEGTAGLLHLVLSHHVNPPI